VFHPQWKGCNQAHTTDFWMIATMKAAEKHSRSEVSTNRPVCKSEEK